MPRNIIIACFKHSVHFDVDSANAHAHVYGDDRLNTNK